MYFKTIVLSTFAALALANPLTPPAKCKPATYACAKNSQSGVPGWQICDTQGVWQYGGDCPPKTTCYFNEVNQSPYCI
ncbi:hypothetical protein SAPIO_CDS7871 [Scedosporium apiospermum]|uniref:CBM1 domain-containing protein n=1 Tax=Pseudallescheria apiosperma TaxID=563466 RepID=A0A084G0V4_PSEDA|nr:uncharacterized protein SAPIO_CDS7871 [Scedosporium apiospermum]KEZ40966.1 hypothetical protein SAPIO_CDS7871 [Scedosporium apiospermum]